MTIPHLKEQAEFYALCLEHGEENVEWRSSPSDGGWTKWVVASDEMPAFIQSRTYQSRLRPLIGVIPETVVPEEDPDGEYALMISDGRRRDSALRIVYRAHYRTAEDRDAVVAAMIRREKR